MNTWFLEWIEEVKARVPRLRLKLAELPGPTLRDWEAAFRAKQITREEAFGALGALAVDPPFADKLAKEAIRLVAEARKARYGERGISPADRPGCPLGCSSGWQVLPESEDPRPGGGGQAYRCTCSGGGDVSWILEARDRDRRAREERGAARLAEWGVDPYAADSELARSICQSFGRGLRPAPVAYPQAPGEEAA